MRLLKYLPKRRKTPKSIHTSPASSRRQSKDAAFAPLFDVAPRQKRPSITMLPRDSASSLSASAPTPSNIHRRLASHNSYHGKRPTLQDILSDRAVEPWTLTAFTNYCEQNLCLENLLFIQAADTYKRDYEAWLVRSQKEIVLDVDQLAMQLIEQWSLMLAHFIATGGPQEVNLTGDVRDALLAAAVTSSPADPELLSPALRLTHRLIEDSILFPFLNESRPPPFATEYDEIVLSPIDHSHSKTGMVQSISHESRPSSRENASRTSRSSATSGPYNTSHPRLPHHNNSLPLQRLSKPKSLFSNLEQSLSSGNTSLDNGNIDDSATSIASPSATNSTARTPPMSPPPSESSRQSQRLRSDSKWRLLGNKLGFRRKDSNNQLGYRSDSGSASTSPP